MDLGKGRPYAWPPRWKTSTVRRWPWVAGIAPSGTDLRWMVRLSVFMNVTWLKGRNFTPLLRHGFCRSLFDRQADEERGPLAGGAGRHDAAPVPFSDPPANRQAHAGSFVLASIVQALKRLEEAVAILLIEANPVILHANLAPAASRGRSCGPGAGGRHKAGLDEDHRRFSSAVELQAIADQVLQQLPHLQRIGVNARQLRDVHAALGLPDALVQIGDDLACQPAQIDGLKGLRLARDANR